MNIHDIIAGFTHQLEEHDIEFRLNEEGAPAVMVEPDSMGPYDNGRVIMEISGISREEEDGYMSFEFLTSIAHNIPFEKYGDLLVKLNELNKREMLGCYGLLDDSGILFHRYTLLVPEATEHPEYDLAEAMGLLLDRIDKDFMELFKALE
ncbi:MAG: hypothetical protein ACI4WS_13460 [Oscillospiraceae bacterium]